MPETSIRVYFNVHLVSDSTGETLNAMLRAASAQFEKAHAIEYNYYLVRSDRQLERVFRKIEAHPGVVWFTIADSEMRIKLEKFCRKLNVPMLPILDASVMMLSQHLGLSASDKVAGQHALNSEYFDRIEAINFALTHDDGQSIEGLASADVVLVGVSRTSKTPTCIYLANRGLRVGNIPLVPGVEPPSFLEELANTTLVVGLRISAERLIQIRKQRLITLQESPEINYTDEETVRTEVFEANRLFQRLKIPIIDVSRRSVEETAASILNTLSKQTR